MRFSTRNSYYLRISATTVLPLYLYLDERHVDWMSERVLQHVLADLRPLVIPKLNAEAEAQLGSGSPADARRGTLDVHRGDTYQFGYFLRGTEPHAVLIKTRMFTPAPPRPTRGVLPAAQGEGLIPQRGKYRSKNSSNDRQKTTKKRKPEPRPRGKGKARAADDEEEAISVSTDDGGLPVGDASGPTTLRRRSKRARKVVVGGYCDEIEDGVVPDVDPTLTSGEPPVAAGNDDDYDPMAVEEPQDAYVVPKHEETEPSLTAQHFEEASLDVNGEASAKAGPSTIDVELVDDEEEVQPKPILKLHYHGFNIHGRCLCVIVEPYPPLRSTARAPSLAPTGLIAPGIASSMVPLDLGPTGGAAQRERTPLFLPDLDREPTPAPSATRVLPPVLMFSETAEGSDEEDGGMVLFSQILRSVGDHPPGIAEDEDEIEGAVFFGDADEMREL